MYKILNRLFANDKIRYLFAGGCTTFVNLIVFFTLRNVTDINRNTCNAIAIMCAIAFAYFANKLFVFKSKTKGLSHVIGEALSFVAARIVSMAIEILGFAILCDSFRLNELVSKILVQFVVLVLNYIFSCFFVFNKERKGFKQYVKENYCYIITFFTILLVMLAICISEGIKPFGSNTLSIVDSLHQYIPFMSEYRDKLMNEGSLFYSFNIALGSNFASLQAYYLSSPFNYILILFSKENIIVGVTILTVLKLCLSGASMVHFLSNFEGEKKQKPLSIAIALAYVFSNYMLGYFWNIMWLDCFIAFPLIMLGFIRLIRNGDAKLYTLSLFYCLYCNYYIGFIICIFLVLCFFVVSHDSVKKFFVDGVRFAIYSLLAGGMSAFMLIPAYFGIMSTAAGDMKLPKWNMYGPFVDLMKQFFIKTKPINSQVFDGGLNIYCGSFAILACVLFAFTKKTKWYEKIKVYLLIAFLFVSFNCEKLNYIWHGMHNQYGIPNRFSFLLIFMLLVMAYKIVDEIEELKSYNICGSFVICAGMIFYVMKTCKTLPDESLAIITLLIITVYAIMLVLGNKKIIQRKIFKVVFCSIFTLEIIINAAFGFSESGYSNYDNKYKTTNDVTAANIQVEKYAEEENALFYRSELMKYTVLDEASFHNMPSVSTFCSTVLGDVVTFMGKVGFYTGANEFLYKGYTPFTNSLLNVRYLLYRDGDLNNFDYSYKSTVSGVDIYENPYPLSIAMGVKKDVKDWDDKTGLAFDKQDDLMHKMTGCLYAFERKYPFYSVHSDTCDVSVSGGNISFKCNSASQMDFTLSFFAEEDGDYYANFRGNGVTNIMVTINDKEYACDRYQGQLFHIGDLKTGDYVTVKYIYNSVPSSKNAYITLATYNHKVFEEAYDYLKGNCMEVTEFEDGYVKGNINIDAGQTIFTSIPYDEGWKLKVDGKDADYYKICGAFIGIDVSRGEHTIELVYVPRGLYVGIGLSILSIATFLALNLVKREKSNKE